MMVLDIQFYDIGKWFAIKDDLLSNSQILFKHVYSSEMLQIITIKTD